MKSRVLFLVVRFKDDSALHEDSPSPYPWITDPAVADYDFLQLIPENQIQQAVQLGLVCEPSADHSYRNPEWATNWMSYEEFKDKSFQFWQMSFFLTKRPNTKNCGLKLMN